VLGDASNSRQDDDRIDVRMPIVERPPSLAEHVRVVLRDDIVSGRLAPGQRLSEAFVTERTGVSRTPVREAMRLLQAEGLVNAERGRGTYVAYRLSSEEALLIYRCRLVIEPYMTGLAAERATEADMDRLEEILRRFATAVADKSARETVSSVDAEFHHAIYTASKSDLLAIFHSYWAKLQLELSTRVYDREVPAHFSAEHEAILEAIRQGDARVSSKLMTAHIKHGERRIKESFADAGER
jgi:DNA-binding GntR family transcriptional regulator